MRKALTVILLICLVLIGKMTMTPEKHEPVTVVHPEDRDTVEMTTVTVHVDGAVGAPGLVVLEAGARTEEAIAKAGGLLPEADTSGLNLARILADQEKVYVPIKGEVGAESATSLIAINLASEQELCELPGVGPTRAKAIIKYREQTPIRGPEDLLSIPGIGEKTVEAWDGLIQY